MYVSIKNSLGKTSVDNILCISGDGPILDMIPHNTVHKVEYPEYDVCDLHQIIDHTYDLVICDQVLEHVKQPFDAVKEMHRVCKPRGILVLTTVFMYPIHEFPKDYWRFTPDGLKQLCIDFSAIIAFGGWGHQDMVKIVADRRQAGLSVPKIHEAGIDKELKKTNPDTPLVTWIIAQK